MIELVIANKLTWISILALLSICMFLFRGLIASKISNFAYRKATAQPLTLGELTSHCKREHGHVEKLKKTEIAGLRDFMVNELKHGSKRFDGVDTKLDKLAAGQEETNVILAVIAKNGGKG